MQTHWNFENEGERKISKFNNENTIILNLIIYVLP